MPQNLDLIFADRRRRATGASGGWVISALFHVTLTAAFVFLPGLFEKPRPQIEYVSVTVVSPAMLGIPEPPPPPPPQVAPPPPKTEPPSPPPPKPAADVPVIKTEKKPRPKAASFRERIRNQPSASHNPIDGLQIRQWRRERDSNPWCLSAQRFSRPPP